jgi:hypothetical protein
MDVQCVQTAVDKHMENKITLVIGNDPHHTAISHRWMLWLNNRS